MKRILKEKLNQMTMQDLQLQAEEIKKELFLQRMKKMTNPEKNTALARNLRKNLACTLTFLRQRELHGE